MVAPSPRIVIYTSLTCPWAHRARIALTASGAKYEDVLIDLKNKPEWYAPNINPASKVPALSYGSPEDAPTSSPPQGTFVLAESALIVNFVASLYPGIDYQDPVTRAKAAFAQLRWEQLIAPNWGKLQRQGGDAETFDLLVKNLKIWSDELPEEVLGSDYGVLDINLGPFVTRLFAYAKSDGGVWAPGTGPKLYTAVSQNDKLVKFHQKLSAWDPVTKTLDLSNLVQTTTPDFKKTYEEKFAATA